MWMLPVWIAATEGSFQKISSYRKRRSFTISVREVISGKCTTFKVGSSVQLVAEAVPHVDGAPCLGSHNRGELAEEIATPEAAAASLDMLSAPPDTRRCSPLL